MPGRRGAQAQAEARGGALLHLLDASVRGSLLAQAVALRDGQNAELGEVLDQASVHRCVGDLPRSLAAVAFVRSTQLGSTRTSSPNLCLRASTRRERDGLIQSAAVAVSWYQVLHFLAGYRPKDLGNQRRARVDAGISFECFQDPNAAKPSKQACSTAQAERVT